MAYGMQGRAAGKDIVPKGYEVGQLQNYGPQAQKLYQQQFGHVGPNSYLGRLAGGDESIFNQIEAPAFRQLQEQLGGLSSRFSGMGMGARRGSGFQNASSQTVSDFAMNLQSQRQALQQQAIMDLMGLSNQILGQQPTDRFMVKKEQKQPSFWQDIAGRFAGAIPGAAMGFLTGGPMGAAMGGGAGFMNSGGSPQLSRNEFMGY